MIPSPGQRFTVTFKTCKRRFDAEMLEYGEGYRIRTFNKIDYDAVGRPYNLPDDVIEVEKNWFDTELTGRIIKLTI